MALAQTCASSILWIASLETALGDSTLIMMAVPDFKVRYYFNEKLPFAPEIADLW